MFSGCIPTLVTPLHQQRLDSKQLHELIEWHLAQECTALCVGGTIGEAYALSVEEQETLFNLVAQSLKRRIPFIAHIVSNSTRKAIWLTQAAEAAGVAAVIHSLTPYHPNPMQQLLQHCHFIQQNTELPIYLTHEVASLNDNDIRLLVEIPKVRGIIDIGYPNLTIKPLLEELDDFTISCGSDLNIMAHQINETPAYFSALANILPLEMQALIKAGKNNEFAKAKMLYQALMPLYHALYDVGLPAGIKSLLSTLQFCREEVHLPLSTLNERQSKIIQIAYKSAQLECDISGEIA